VAERITRGTADWEIPFGATWARCCGSSTGTAGPSKRQWQNNPVGSRKVGNLRLGKANAKKAKEKSKLQKDTQTCMLSLISDGIFSIRNRFGFLFQDIFRFEHCILKKLYIYFHLLILFF